MRKDRWGTPLQRAGRGGNIEVHSYACAEAGLDLAIVDETDAVVEGQRVRIRSDLDALYVFARGNGHDVSQQVATHSAPHPVRVDEQVLQLQDPLYGKRGRKANNVIPRQGCGDTATARTDALPGQDQRLGVSQKRRHVPGVGQ
jgi:hypothetical protein